MEVPAAMPDDPSVLNLHESARAGADDPMIAISMTGNLIVLRPRDHLDLDSTRALVTAVDAAVHADTPVLIDLDGTSVMPLPPPPARLVSLAAAPVATIGTPTIDVIAAGCIRLSSPGNHWTIDLSERRFCRSSAPVDRRFVGAEGWTDIRTIWATHEGVSVLTSNNSIISTATRWIAAA